MMYKHAIMRLFDTDATIDMLMPAKSLTSLPFTCSAHSAAAARKACEQGMLAAWSHRPLPSHTLQKAGWKLLYRPLQQLQI
jgi:hypothetical protein